MRETPRPGRFRRPGLSLFFAALGALSCARDTPPPPVVADRSIAGSPVGVVLLTAEFPDNDPEMVPGLPERFLWSREGAEARDEPAPIVEVSSAQRGDVPTTDYWVELAPGRYDRQATSKAGPLGPRRYRLSFTVAPGEVVYVGTLRFRSLPAGVRVRDDFAATVARFRQSHPLLGADVVKRLIEKRACGPDVPCAPEVAR